MRILVLSDLHLELGRNAPKQAKELLEGLQTNLDACRPDLVILAGDIDVGDRAVAWAHQSFPHFRSFMFTETMRATARRSIR